MGVQPPLQTQTFKEGNRNVHYYSEVLSLGSLARTLQEALEAMDISASASAYPPERKKGALVLTRGNRSVYVHTSVKDADDYFQQLRPVIFRSIPVNGLELTAIFGE